MGGPDRFDTLQMLGTTVDKGTPDAPAIPGDSAPNALVQTFTSPNTAQNVVVGNDNRPLASDGIQRQPAGVDRFNGGV